MESTTALLRRIWQGDARAEEALARAYLPVVKRLAHGRLPDRARGLVSTDDLVSVTMAKAFRDIQSFRPYREGAFLAYVRKILLNEIRTQIRRANVRPIAVPEERELVSRDPSPLEALLGDELLERYESALERLTPEQREAVVLRIEMRLNYQEVADALAAPSPDAARMLVARALVHLARELREDTRATASRTT